MFLQCNSKMLFCSFWSVPSRLCLCLKGCWSNTSGLNNKAYLFSRSTCGSFLKACLKILLQLIRFFFWVLLSLFLSCHLFVAASVFSLREVQLQKDPGHRSSVFHPLGKFVPYRLTEWFHTASFSEVIIIRSHYHRVTVHKPGVPKLDIQWSKSDF